MEISSVNNELNLLFNHFLGGQGLDHTSKASTKKNKRHSDDVLDVKTEDNGHNP